MNDQKSEFADRRKRNRKGNVEKPEKKTLIDKHKLEYTKEKPAKKILKKYYNGII